MFSTEGGSAAKMLAIICHRFKLSCYMFYSWFSLLYDNNQRQGVCQILVTIPVLGGVKKTFKPQFYTFFWINFQALSLWLQPITGMTVICFVFFFPYKEFARSYHLYSQTECFFNFLLQSFFLIIFSAFG